MHHSKSNKQLFQKHILLLKKIFSLNRKFNQFYELFMNSFISEW